MWQGGMWQGSNVARVECDYGGMCGNGGICGKGLIVIVERVRPCISFYVNFENTYSNNKITYIMK